jgi:hypothetical protein
MKFENRRWLVIPTSVIDDIDSLRKSLDDTLTFVKYEVNIVEETYTQTFENIETGEEVTNTVEAGIYGRPSVYSEEYIEYNHEDILELLSTEEWIQQIEE